MRAVLCLALSLLALSIAAAGPAIWQVQGPVQPGETVMLFGDGFGDKPQVLLGRADDDSADVPGGRGSTHVSYGEGATVLQASEQCLKVLIAPRQKPGIYSLLVGDSLQAATAVLINRPVIWWMQTDWGAKPKLRLFGKNLAGPKAQVYLKGPTTVALKIGKQADTWAATVGLPDKLPDGDYEVSITPAAAGSWAGAWACRSRWRDRSPGRRRSTTCATSAPMAWARATTRARSRMR